MIFLIVVLFLTSIGIEGRPQRVHQDDQVNDLPGTLLDPSSIIFEEGFRCEAGEVVIDTQCVPCPAGTYFDTEGEARCSKCPIGTYNPTPAQLSCQTCGLIQEKPGVTETEGATSDTQCKENCAAGHYYDQITDLCRPCGHARYQPSEGKFSCLLCGVGLTTRTKESLSRDECREDCKDGHQLSISDTCEVCPLSSYRTRGVHRGCQQCQIDRTTSKTGAKTEADCNLPICIPGQFNIGMQYFNATTHIQCQPCPMGQYQPLAQQTQCLACPADTSTVEVTIGLGIAIGATSKDQCSNPCSKTKLCDKMASCRFQPKENNPNYHFCECKLGYKGNGTLDDPCIIMDNMDSCEGHCKNDGRCLKTNDGKPYCLCGESFAGNNCEIAHIAGGITVENYILLLLQNPSLLERLCAIFDGDCTPQRILAKLGENWSKS